ncbi:AAA family ATPase [Variovorax sp. RKNM96]|uniref:ATP-binding protein n=1 Tax=Variovorax sp. RKNM96 TaxID=2681552 RepID=UPI0019804AEE|nr:ATP-binding protein [Variovorax sp. RKNM96]QSI31073.1 AAA family ATPase [Variovorax sp. RKNM96]
MNTTQASSGQHPRRGGSKPSSATSRAIHHRREIEEAAAKLEENRLARFRTAYLANADERRRLAAFHPLLEQKYFIETDETANFYDIVCDHAMARKSGLYITGEFRVGKTTAIENAVERLRRDMPWLAVLVHSAKRKPNQSKTALCNDMAASFRCPTSRYQDSADLLARFMMAEAVLAGSRTCLLFIDEAQMFTVLHMRYLLEIWNELRLEGFLLVSVLVGQEGLESLKMLTSEEDHGAVVARFFVKRFDLGGLHKLAELVAYLRAFDGALCCPTDVWPYSRFFCQRAFDAGWRLEHEADRLWTALVDYTNTDERTLSYAGFRLAFVNDAIHAFLLDSMRNDGSSFKGTSSVWKEAVQAAADSELFVGRGRGNH